MAKNSGNSRRTAKPIALQNRSRTIKDSIGIDDRLDFYQFRVANRSSFNLVLRGLKARANVALLNGGGQLIQQARRPGQQPRRMSTVLDPGLYYVRVTPHGRKGTTYRLQMATTTLETIAMPGGNIPVSIVGSPRPSVPVVEAGSNSGGGTNLGGSPANPNPSPVPTPRNTAPVVTVNQLLSVDRGGVSRLNSSVLRSTDREQNANQLVYTVTQLPQWGRLQLNGRSLNLNETFTQADLDNDRVSYQQQATTQLVTNQTLVGSPQISGNNIVWAALQGGNSEIFFYNGATGQTRQITSNTVDDVNPQISGSDIVWQRGTGTNAKLFFYNGATGTIKPLSEDGTFTDKQPSISPFNGKTTIAWQRDFTDDSDIKMYIGSLDETRSLTGGNDTNPLVSGANIAFERRNLNRPNLGGIYLYNTEIRSLIPVVVNTQTKLTGISGNTIVWEQFLPATQERDVHYATVGEISETIAQNSDYDDFAALISGSHIVFTRNQISGDAEDGLYLFNTQTKSLKRLSNSALDVATSISGSNVVWQRSNGNQSNIFFYNGTLNRTVPLTSDGAGGFDSNLNHRNPALSGANVVWQSGTGATSNQLFFYNGNATRDRFNFRVSDGLLSSNGAFDIAIR